MSADAVFAPPVATLGQQVIDRLGIPKDEWEIAAQLEVLGLRDSDARTMYGAHDLFDLARDIWQRFRAGELAFYVEGEDPRPPVIRFVRFVRRYFAGISFALPMALQAASMLLWGYGLWGAIDLELTQGSGVALGFVASYVVAGGFIQALVRRGLFYIYQKEETLARWTALRGFAIALRAVLLLAIPAAAMNAVFHILPWSMMSIALIFYVGLAILWLSWALLYLVRKTYFYVVITALSLAVVIASAKLMHVPPLVANVIGIAFADAISFALAWFLLRRMVKKSGALEPVNPPRLAVLVYSTSRYFVYGLLFNAFLFADRVIAWTTSVGRDDFPPYPFWLSVRYELALDLALVVVIVMSGMLELTNERFSEELVPREKRKGVGVEAFIADQTREHRYRTFELLLAAGVAFGVALVVVGLLRSVPNVRLQEALNAPMTMRVFVAAAIGYMFFVFAVRNLLMLLTLSRVGDAMRSVAIALAVDVVTGFVCSRAIHYAAAVAGLVAGAIVMSLVAGRAVRRVLADLDYYYYAAF